MTEDEIRTTPKGIELDKLVAKMKGWKDIKLEEIKGCPYCGDEMRFCGSRSWCSTCHEWRYSPYKEYSQDDLAALELVDETLPYSHFSLYTIGRMWYCFFDMKYGSGLRENVNVLEVRADTRPEAITKAYLLFKLNEQELSNL